ncbi:MAG TPA: methyltransferase domain-containing protein [Gemmatimonadales bacterium]
MHPDAATPTVLRTTAGDLPLHEYRLRLAGREWAILHTGALLTPIDEAYFLDGRQERVPYGVALWPSSIALAHELIARAGEMSGTRLLELGAGTGLPGIVAASLGARVTQTDRQELALTICRRNVERNHATGIECRAADWSAWDDPATYDWIIGSDVLYAESMHPHLRAIMETNLAPGGRVLLADPFRPRSLVLLEKLESSGWTVAMSTWSVGEEGVSQRIGLFELAPPRQTLRQSP